MRLSRLGAAALIYGAAHAANLGAPIDIPPSQYWDGIDGPWSTFGFMVGSPPQNVRLLPGMTQSSTTVVDVRACTPESGELDQDCADNRGGVYDQNATTTYSDKGIYEVPLFWEKNLGYAANASYGYDKITLGWQGNNLPSLDGQLVDSVLARRYYLGTLALNPRPLNFTDLNEPQINLLLSLKNHSESPIPSLSWSYTAGAYNHEPKVYGSLVLGGYDASRFEPNDVSFPFGQDISADTMVAVRSVTTDLSTRPLLGNAVFALVTTMVPEMWLPVDACREFEDAFGLTYDNATGLYPLSDDLHESLLSKNPSVSVTVGPEVNGPSVRIDMPYWNFYLSGRAPYVANSTRFFPLRRAANDTQYTLGRTFLQSAHISIDFERGVFNVSQALYPSNVPQEIVAVLPPLTPTNISEPTTSDDSKTSSSLSTGAKAGIGVGAAAAVAALVALVFLVLRRRRARRDAASKKAELDAVESQLPKDDANREYYQPGGAELGQDSAKHEMGDEGAYKAELVADTGYSDAEKYGTPRTHEMDGGGSGYFVHEMPAGDVPLPELETPSGSAAGSTYATPAATPGHAASLGAGGAPGPAAYFPADGKSPLSSPRSPPLPQQQQQQQQQHRAGGARSPMSPPDDESTLVSSPLSDRSPRPTPPPFRILGKKKG